MTTFSQYSIWNFQQHNNQNHESLFKEKIKNLERCLTVVGKIRFGIFWISPKLGLVRSTTVMNEKCKKSF